MKLTKTFTIKDNVNLDVIFEFIEFYKNDNKSGYNSVKINIAWEEHSPNKIIGEIDPIFLSYLILFLKDYPDFTVEFKFNNIESADRAFSLKDQLEQINYLTNLNEQIFLNGNYINKTTSEIIAIKLEKKLTQSQKFIPPLFIENDLDFKKYFIDKYASNHDNELWNSYFIKLENEIEERAELTDDKNYSQKIGLVDLSFFETCLFNLLLSGEIYEKRNVNKIGKKIIIENDRKKILYYKQFIYDISVGIKELARNIIEHSSEHKGVITCRFFDKKRISELKGKSENEYLLQIKDDYFLDINVIDFGKFSIRETYLKNLNDNSSNLINYLGNSLVDDKKIIEKQYDYEDFFTINIDKFINLEHQQNKIVSRYGLHYFTHIIKENYAGFIKTSSINEGVLFYKKGDNSDFKSKFDDFTKYGTVYNCIIPLNSSRINTQSENSIYSYQKKETQSINTFIELDKFEIIDYKENIKDDYTKKIIFNYSKCLTTRNLSKYELIINIFKEFEVLHYKLRDNIIAIDSKDINIESESDWVRLLSCISLFFCDVIIYNINISNLIGIINIRRITSKHPLLKFWNNENRILFYSYKYDDEQISSHFKRFGATILTGEKEIDFDNLNKNIWRHHYSFKDKVFSINNNFNTENANYITDVSKLFNNGKLIYFELLLKNKDKHNGELSLFEESVQYSLNKRFDVLRNTKTNNKGYKISNTHFRLGSKIHIEDFYYAKRMFQNSFFTIPLSYLISNTIFELIKDKVDGVTIIGYEDYSLFLTSSIRNILEKKIRHAQLKISVNHNTINKEGKLSKEVKTIKKNVIIVVPIVSSFSTSIKIYNQLVELFKSNKDFKFKNDYNLEFPTLNVVLVGHNQPISTGYIPFEELTSDEIDQIELEKSNGKYYLYENELLNKVYNWYSINKINKIIKIKTFINEKFNNKQKYYIPVYTEWHNADNCELCYSVNINKEKCLIETGKTSITPTLIFGYPKTKAPNKYGLNILNLKESLLYGNLIKRNNHYLYFTPTGNLVKNNIVRIKDWLKILKNEVFNYKLLEFKKIVLVTPATGTKSNFVDLVNEYIFEYTANCISVSLEEDYIENAESLYDDGLYQADIVIFVDDVLSTIKSFLDTNNIIKFIRKKIRNGNGIDFCISLINRMTYDSEDNLLLELPKNSPPILEQADRLFYFTKINNPSIEEPNNEFPLTKEMNRYEYLANTSSLDGTRELFLNKINKLKPVDIEQNVPIFIKDHLFHFNKKLFQLLIINEFYKLFEINNDDELGENNFQNYRKLNIDNYFNENISSFILLESRILSELKKDTFHIDITTLYTHNLNFIILKIMCGTPLIYYQDIRNSAFHWIIFKLELLRKEMDDLNSETIKSFFSVNSENVYSKFQQFKFLLKRSVQLKSNYIIHIDFFISIGKFINLISEEKDLLTDLFELNKDVYIRLKNLFDTTRFIPGRLTVYNYLKEFKHLIPEDVAEDYRKFMDSIDPLNLTTESKKYSSPSMFDIEDVKKIEFNSFFRKIQLTEKFNIISSKKLIYQLLALIQELINEHETKAIKLENNIDSLIVDESDIINGNFNHYLRLLKLENTAIIERFWEYFKNKETVNCFKEIDIYEFENNFKKYDNDPKYLPIIQNLENKCRVSFTSFIKLQSILYNWSIKEYENNDETDMNEKVSIILMLLSEIIDDINSVYLTVNYNNLLIPLPDQLYTFEYHCNTTKNKSNLFNSSKKYEDSLTYKMLCGIKDDDYSLSNLEIIKDEGGFHIRTGIFRNEEIENFTEIISLRAMKEFSILVVRLSDLFNSNEITLYSNAVLTFILNKGNRIDISKLRLILILKKYLCEFIKTETTKNTFLELLKNKERDDFQSNLRHGLDDYFMYQNSITQSKDFSEKSIIILDAINGAIKGQIGSYDTTNSVKKEYTKLAIEIRINALLDSNLIEGKTVSPDNYSIEFNDINTIILDTCIYDVVLLELIINAKRHSPFVGAGIFILFERDQITIRNNVKEDSSVRDRGRDGLNMCKRICEDYELGYKLIIEDNKEIFKVIIKFPYDEKHSNY